MSISLPIVEAYDRSRKIANKPFRAICYAPFNSMFLDTKGHVRACCVNTQFLLGDITKQRLDDIWFGPNAQRLREAMKNYDLSCGCEFCEWQLGDGNFAQEESHYSSLHALKYDAYPVDESESLWPSNLEFNLSNNCNLECVMCDGFFSSSIRSRREKLPPLPRAYKDEFFEDLRKYIPHVRTAEFLGGEPFLSNEHFRVWDMMIQDRAIEVCYITTNGTIYNHRVQRVLDNLPCAITMSMDGVTKETFEKIRVNAKFDVFLDNFARFDEYLKAKDWCVGINFTLSRLNWHEFPEMCLFAEERGSLVAVCTMAEPKHLSLYTLPAEELQPVLDAFERRDDEMNRVLKKNLTSWRNAIQHFRNRLEKAREEAAKPLRLLEHSTKVQPTDQPMSMGELAHAKPAEETSRTRHNDSRKINSFRGCQSQSLTEQMENERKARELLASWSGDVVHTLYVADDDQVVAVDGEDERFFGVETKMIGRPVDELMGVVVELFGPLSEVRDLKIDVDCVDRMVGFGATPEELVYTRVISLPRFDETGKLSSTAMLCAKRPAMDLNPSER